MFSHWPTAEPSEAPIWTMGPSRPTEPPVPMQMPEAIIFAITTRGRMRPPCSITASMTSGTPCPLASRAKRRMIRPTTRPPAAGVATIHHQWCARTPSRVKAGICQAWACTNSMNSRKPTAQRPPSSPTAAAMSTMTERSALRTSGRSLERKAFIRSRMFFRLRAVVHGPKGMSSILQCKAP